MNSSLPVESVSDTAFLTAQCRAIESERADAHFHDPHARLLAGDRGRELLQRFPGGSISAAGCIVRTCLLDEMIQQTIGVESIDTVINLGAGLDTRPYRLKLPPSLRWIEVDQPAVLDYKASKLTGHAAGCVLQSEPLDLMNDDARRQLLAQTAAVARRMMVVTEGVLIYLTREQVAALACDFSAQSPLRWWLCDLASPMTLRLAFDRTAWSAASSDVKLHFAPEEGSAFFRPYGWNSVECRWSLEEGRRLQRRFVPDDYLAQFSPKQQDALRRLTAVVKLQRFQESCTPFPEKSLSQERFH